MRPPRQAMRLTYNFKIEFCRAGAPPAIVLNAAGTAAATLDMGKKRCSVAYAKIVGGTAGGGFDGAGPGASYCLRSVAGGWDPAESRGGQPCDLGHGR